MRLLGFLKSERAWLWVGQCPFLSTYDELHPKVTPVDNMVTSCEGVTSYIPIESCLEM